MLTETNTRGPNSVTSDVIICQAWILVVPPSLPCVYQTSSISLSPRYVPTVLSTLARGWGSSSCMDYTACSPPATNHPTLSFFPNPVWMSLLLPQAFQNNFQPWRSVFSKPHCLCLQRTSTVLHTSQQPAVVHWQQWLVHTLYKCSVSKPKVSVLIFSNILIYTQRRHLLKKKDLLDSLSDYLLVKVDVTLLTVLNAINFIDESFVRKLSGKRS